MYAKLESLRGIAACLVVIYHAPFLVGDGLHFVKNSFLFVDFFFIISGFVISFAYSQKITAGLSFANFTFLRLSRIYPLHIFMLILFVAYKGLKVLLYSYGYGNEQTFEKDNIFSFITNVLLIHSMGVHNYETWNFPSWSISVEFFTYLSFFLLLRSFDKHKGLIFPTIIFFLGYFVILPQIHNSLNITFDYGFIRCLSGFYLGVFLYRVLPLLINTINDNINLAEITAFGLIIIAVSYAHNSWINQLLAIASFFIGLAVFASNKNGYLGHFLHFRIIRNIGLWSYSIYMTHMLVIYIYNGILDHILRLELNSIVGMQAIVANTIIVISVILASRYTYTYVEDKFRRIAKDKLHRNVAKYR